MGHQPSPSSYQFATVPQVHRNRSTFDRSHGFKTTFDSGYLVPFLVDDILPGDTVKIRPTFFARLATPQKPIMDNLWFDWQVYFVPNRLVWTNFVKQMGEQTNPGDSVDFLTPISTSPVGGYANQSLQDYMGLPTLIAGYTHCALPTRAYNLIWNQHFRDENMQDSITVDTGNGPDTVTNYVLRRRGKRHDYFTSCLPDPQKGPAVQIPLGDTAPVVTDGLGTQINFTTTGDLVTQLGAQWVNGEGITTNPNPSSGSNIAFGDQTGLEADLTEATAATVNDIRLAVATQQLFEMDARGGTRYIELILSHFGVQSSDARLQRPEYIGGGSTRISIHPVTQTAPTDPNDADLTPQGNLAAMGYVDSTGSVVKSFEEHGWLIGLFSVRADLTYQQGLARKWKRQTKLDYFWPVLENIGEQAVTADEIYCQGTSDDDIVFGYQERFAEYKYFPSIVTGKFRSNDPQSLDIWLLTQEFGSRPELNSAFIEENPPVERIVAVPSEPEFLLDSYIRYHHTRAMATQSVPGLKRF